MRRATWTAGRTHVPSLYVLGQRPHLLASVRNRTLGAQEFQDFVRGPYLVRLHFSSFHSHKLHPIQLTSHCSCGCGYHLFGPQSRTAKTLRKVGLGPDLARHYWVDFCYGVAVGDPTSKPVLTWKVWKHNNCRRPKRRQWNICPLGRILLSTLPEKHLEYHAEKHGSVSVIPRIRTLGPTCLWHLRKYYACWFTHSKDVESNLSK